MTREFTVQFVEDESRDRRVILECGEEREERVDKVWHCHASIVSPDTLAQGFVILKALCTVCGQKNGETCEIKKGITSNNM